jgi:hypothetical protein
LVNDIIMYCGCHCHCHCEKYSSPNGFAETFAETSAERRTRAIKAYNKLQDLVEKYEVKLTRPYTINDDPNEMEEEYIMHKEYCDRKNHVRMYKNILFSTICGLEYLNEKNGPYLFRLKDWSRQFNMDLDDYTDVLEALYEKYNSIEPTKLSPEAQLIIRIITAGITYHLSQELFGPDIHMGKALNLLESYIKQKHTNE